MAKQSSYGLGFSPLSMQYAKEHAFVEELVVNEEAGMLGVVDNNNKDIISQDYLIRTKYQLTSFINRMMQDNTLGKLYRINLNDYFATNINVSGKNLVEGSELKINIGAGNMYGVRFNLDVDVFSIETSSLFSWNDIHVEIELTFKKGFSSVKNIIHEDADGNPININYVNTTAFAVDYSSIAEEEGDLECSITSIKLLYPDSFDLTKYRILIYDILVLPVERA